MKVISCALLMLTLLLSRSELSAQGSEIEFKNEMTWNAIREKAKSLRKYIFLECYATWCVPCKLMDNETYSNIAVGQYFNEHFISARVQIDTSKNDDDLTKMWYEDANTIKKLYKVELVPSFLFFSPDGELVHRAMGYKDTMEIINIAKSALDSNHQYYALLKKYDEKNLSPQETKELSLLTMEMGDKSFLKN